MPSVIEIILCSITDICHPSLELILNLTGLKPA